MTDAALKEKMEERQMCEEAPGVGQDHLDHDHHHNHQDQQVCTHLLIFASIFLVIVTLPLSLCLIIKVGFDF